MRNVSDKNKRDKNQRFSGLAVSVIKSNFSLTTAEEEGR